MNVKSHWDFLLLILPKVSQERIDKTMVFMRINQIIQLDEKKWEVFSVDTNE